METADIQRGAILTALTGMMVQIQVLVGNDWGNLGNLGLFAVFIGFLIGISAPFVSD